MRVLQVDSGREWRGGQNQVRLLSRELAREPEVEQLLVTNRGSELARRAGTEGVRLATVPWVLSLDPRAIFAIHDLVKSFRPAIVHAHDSHALSVALHSRPWGRDDAGGGPILVATRRVDFPTRRGSVKRFFFGSSPWLKAAHILAISQAVKEILVADGCPAGEITVVPSGIDAEEVRAAARRPLDVRARVGLEPATPLAVNVAALVDHKDHRTLIGAAHHARTLRPDLHWVIAGEGALRGSLEAEIARLELGDRVHLLGYLEEADALIGEADVFVMSSKEEGLGSVILNALALEKPVVGTAAGGIPEILPPRALVPVGDAAALARKVVETLDHPSPLPLPPRFTAPAMARGVLAVYRSLL